MRRCMIVCLLSPALVLAAGCGGGIAKAVKVKGNVTLDGKPLAGATVSFIPRDKSGGRAASGRTDTSGDFQLTTFRTDDGAVPGEYKVIVVLGEEAKDVPAGNPMEMDEKERMAFFTKMNPDNRAKEAAKRTKSQVPAVYSDPEKTPLKEVVPAPSDVKLALKSSAR